MPPFNWPETFKTKYDCLTFGYEESLKKMKEIGREDVNKYGAYIKFYCTPQSTI
jgi:thiaminase